MIILSVNAGSSSLKFTGFKMPEEEVIVSGLFERIGIAGSCYTIKLNGEKIKKERDLPNHEEAVKILIDELLLNGVIKSLDEIEGVGHRLVHGGEKYANSVIIDDDVIERNPVLAEKLYEVQYCDIMAQDTKYLKDRVDYLTTTNYKLKKRRSRLYKKR